MLWLALLCGAAVSATPDERQLSRPDSEELVTSEATRVLETAIERGAFPGCSVAVGTRERVLWRAAFGRFDYSGGAGVRTDTLYDLASLTKVVGTTSVIFTLIRDGKLSLDEPVSRTLTELTFPGANSITVEHLLTHSGGLPAWKPFYKQAHGYENVLARVMATPLEAAPGTRYHYSDLGFMLLGELARRVEKKPLADLERERIFEPLGMRETRRNPGPDLKTRIAPTERVPAESPEESSEAPARYFQGVVHDENARAADGITGHAGLFSTVEDLTVFATELLRGLSGESAVFPAGLLGLFTSRSHVLAGSSRALGWGMKTRGGSAGGRMNDSAFGHTGFTGTSMWIDPERGFFVILLTNRVHPTRSNNQIRAVRRELADAVTVAFDEWESTKETTEPARRERGGSSDS